VPRLFTALEIPAAIGESLARLRGGLSGARWIDVGNYHLTLRFIGDVDDRLARDVEHSLYAIRRPAPVVALEELIAFGGDKPRAIVAKARLDSALIELQAEQERLMRRLGASPESRKFSPHVTLARLRGASPMAVADYLSARGYFPSLRFTPSRFVLYSSKNSVGGGPYVVEAAYPFVARRELLAAEIALRPSGLA
jgi:2'-5' RNA ligase